MLTISFHALILFGDFVISGKLRRPSSQSSLFPVINACSGCKSSYGRDSCRIGHYRSGYSLRNRHTSTGIAGVMNNKVVVHSSSVSMPR
jgi:hypothetical protein